jgi:hypothetical protein
MALLTGSSIVGVTEINSYRMEEADLIGETYQID